MGNYISTCNGIKSVSIIKSTKNDLLLNKTIIRLVLVGLDNSGKTSTALHLLKKPVDDLIPTLGFNSYTLDSPALYKNKETKVDQFDLGGSEKIRQLWTDYYASAHGLVCLLDSADSNRFKEIKIELEKILSNRNVQGKPLLILLNKMDLDEAMDEVEICNAIDIEHLANENKCPTKIEQCAVKNDNKSSISVQASDKKKKTNLDSGIEQGFNWIVNYIVSNWDKLSERVRSETEKLDKENKEKMNALREKYRNSKDENTEQQQQEDTNISEQKKKENPFKPIAEVVKEIEKKEKTKNGLKEESSVKSQKSSVKKTDLLKDEKTKSRNKLTEKILEVKKKVAVVRQTKIADKTLLEKQDSKGDDQQADIKTDLKTDIKVDSKDVNNESKELKDDLNEKNTTEEKRTTNEMSENSTATNSMDTMSTETVIEMKK